MSISSFFNVLGGSTYIPPTLPASFRGIEFGVVSVELGGVGRNVVTHQLVYNDPFTEDMGPLPTTVEFDAVIVGDDVFQQEAALIAAFRTPGQGTLVHPSLGSLNASCGPVSMRHVGLNVIEFTVTFTLSPVLTTNQMPMSVAIDTQAAVLTASANLSGSLPTNFYNNAGSLIGSTEYAVPTVVSTIGGFTALIANSVNDVNRSIGSASGISIDPSLTTGRYGNGNIFPTNVLQGIDGLTSITARQLAAKTIASTDSANAKAAVLSAISTVTSLAAAI